MKITVWGTGVTGVETAREMIRQGHEVRLVDEKLPENMPADIPVKLIEADDLRWANLVIPSPGIPRDHKLFKHASNILSEIEMAARLLRGKLIAVTGTNGKTTTVTLIHRVLQHAGLNAGLGGNINPPLISLVKDNPDYVVAEISSFQLEWTQEFRPHIALCLNITPDHLDRYRSMQEYVDFKLRLFENQLPEDHAIINHDDDYLRELKPNAKLSRFALHSYIEGIDCIRDNRVYFDGRIPGPRLPDIKVIGEGIAEDMLACAIVCQRLGVENQVMEEVFAEFKVISHRYELVGEHDGVRFIDDSKATNVGAMQKAIAGTSGKVVLIVGGIDKGGSFRNAVKMYRNKISGVIILGSQAPRIKEEIKNIVEIEEAACMQEAVTKAFAGAKPGETVLLSPGCASFDLFRSYAHRGEVFVQCVQEIMKSAS